MDVHAEGEPDGRVEAAPDGGEGLGEPVAGRGVGVRPPSPEDGEEILPVHVPVAVHNRHGLGAEGHATLAAPEATAVGEDVAVEVVTGQRGDVGQLHAVGVEPEHEHVAGQTERRVVRQVETLELTDGRQAEAGLHGLLSAPRDVGPHLHGPREAG